VAKAVMLDFEFWIVDCEFWMVDFGFWMVEGGRKKNFGF